VIGYYAMSITCTLDSSIKLDPRDLPKNVLDEIFNHLRIPNPQKKIAEREMLWGAENLPDYIELWKYNGHNELILPRGFLGRLNIILVENNFPINYTDKTESDDNYLYDIPEISLRKYQNEAVADLIANEHGIYKAPTGSGKTRVMLEIARECHQKTLAICEKTDILAQWMDSALDLNFGDVGNIGNGTWFEGPDIVFALRQSLINRSDLDQDWYDQWGMVIIDECHHLCSADTLIDLVQRFPARYRFGCSATPDSDPDLFPIASAVIGPVVHESTPEEIGEHLVIPSVKVVKTDFEFPYRPTVRAGNKVIRNNYNNMMGFLQSSKRRNRIIMKEVYREAVEGHKCLVVSKRKLHFHNLYEVMNQEYPELNLFSFELTGDNSSHYADIKNKIENSSEGSVLFSTLADEGTDIPCMDRIFLTYPGRKLRGYEQAIGRIMRPHPKKKDAIVYDFRDANVSILNSQYRFRAQNIYNKKNYKVEHINE